MEPSIYAARFEVSVGAQCWMLVRRDRGRLERVGPVSDWLLARRPGCSPNSLERWARSLSLWWRWCVDTGVDPMRPAARQFSDYVTRLQTIPWRKPLTSSVAALPGDKRLRDATTVRQRVDDVKRFYAWALDQENLVPATNAHQITRFRAPRAVQVRTAPRLEPQQVKALQSADLHPRDRLMCELAHGAGLRAGELLSLQTQDMCVNDEVAQVFGCRQVRFFGPHLHVRQRPDHPRGARSKAPANRTQPRVVPMTQRVLMAYQDWQVWLFEHMPEAIESRYVLLSLGYPTKGQPWSYEGLCDRWGERIKAIPGLENSWPHLLRHTYASELADAGVDLMVIQELLGHRSPTSTEIYTHPQAADMVDAVMALHDWRTNAIGAQ